MIVFTDTCLLAMFLVDSNNYFNIEVSPGSLTSYQERNYELLYEPCSFEK